MGQPRPLFRLFSYFRLLSVLTSLRAQVQKPKHNFQAFSICYVVHVVPAISMFM